MKNGVKWRAQGLRAGKRKSDFPIWAWLHYTELPPSSVIKDSGKHFYFML